MGGEVREIGVDELDAALGAGEGLLEAGDFAVHLGNEPVAGEEFGGGVGDVFEFMEFGREIAVGLVAGGDEGEVPVRGDAAVESLNLPAGGGHVADDGVGGLVQGLVDGDEIFDEGLVLIAILIAEDGFVGRNEAGELLGALAVFEGVAGGSFFTRGRYRSF